MAPVHGGALSGASAGEGPTGGSWRGVSTVIIHSQPKPRRLATRSTKRACGWSSGSSARSGPREERAGEKAARGCEGVPVAVGEEGRGLAGELARLEAAPDDGRVSAVPAGGGVAAPAVQPGVVVGGEHEAPVRAQRVGGKAQHREAVRAGRQVGGAGRERSVERAWRERELREIGVHECDGGAGGEPRGEQAERGGREVDGEYARSARDKRKREAAGAAAELERGAAGEEAEGAKVGGHLEGIEQALLLTGGVVEGVRMAVALGGLVRAFGVERVQAVEQAQDAALDRIRGAAAGARDGALGDVKRARRRARVWAECAAAAVAAQPRECCEREGGAERRGWPERLRVGSCGCIAGHDGEGSGGGGRRG